MEDNINKEKPPEKVKDNYKCIKVNLKDILSNKKHISNKVFDIINKNVFRVNKITEKTYFLLRKWVLTNYYNNNKNIPLITTDLIHTCNLSFLIKKNNALELKPDIKKLVEDFEELQNFEKMDGENIKDTLKYYNVTILTSIENNIKNNFLNYINRFVNNSFKKIYEKEINNKDFKENLMSELKVVKDDIINNTLNCDEKYHEWLNEHRSNIFPENPYKGFYYEIKSNPQKYLKYMIYMCIEMEKINAKFYQFFPLQTSCIPKNIVIDTGTIINFFVDKGCAKMRNKIDSYKVFLWNKYFKIKQHLTGYNFDYTIITDGYSASIRFIEKNFNILNNIKKERLRIGRNKTKGISAKIQTENANKKKSKKVENNEEKERVWQENNLKNKEKTEKKDKYKQNIKNIEKFKKTLEKNIKKVYKLSSKKLVKKNNEDINILKNEIEDLNNKILGLKGEVEKYEEENNVNEEKNVNEEEIEKKVVKPKKIEEFPYIDEVDKSILEGNHIFIDPGKRTLLTMMNDDGKFLSYTNRHWLTKTCRLKYRRTLEKHKKENDKKETDDNKKVIKNEALLSDFKFKKSCNIENFQSYMDIKMEVNTKVYSYYENPIFRRYKWYSFINRKRELDKMVNLIEKTFNKDGKKELKIIIGDWSVGKSMRNFISTPNLTIKRKLKERFKHVYNIDEFRTSCLSYVTEEKCKNLYLTFPNRKNSNKIEKQKIHAVLTYKMKSNRIGCINRDKNGCKNIQKLFNSFIETGDIPEKYKRGIKIE